MRIEILLGLLTSALILVVLILNIKNSRRFNVYDRLLHHKLIKQRDGRLWHLVTLLNEPKLIVLWDFALAAVLIWQGHWTFAIWVLATLAITDAIGIFLKRFVKRKRPMVPDENRDGYSFPSGHVLSATIMALMIWKLFGQQLGLALLIVLLIGWGLVVVSRLNMRAHYPSDVLGATSLAILCFLIAQSLI